jgi:hypothetical protein
VSSFRTVATHEVVQALHPRPFSPEDELGKAVGKAIDSALSRYSHEFSRNLRPTSASIQEFAVMVLDEELLETDVELSGTDRAHVLTQIGGVLKAFRKSEVFGLPRPRSRLIVINNEVGVYAQPDYWDERNRFYEMKSYHAFPFPPDVDLQLRLFQLAFPGFAGFLACFDRHAEPPVATIDAIPPRPESEVKEVLVRARQIALERGKEKVLEYVDSPMIRYEVAVGPEVLAPTGADAGPSKVQPNDGETRNSN